MEYKLYLLHLRAGIVCGKATTCGVKKAYTNEELAVKAATSHNSWDGRKHDVEPYPCAFCGFWHVGGIMTLEDLERITSGYRQEGVAQH